MTECQAQVRGLYLVQAQVLQRSADPADQALGAKVEAFVRSMPQPDSQRLALARELRAANRSTGRSRSEDGALTIVYRSACQNRHRTCEESRAGSEGHE